MLKVYKLIGGSLDKNLISKLMYLDRLVRLYAKFLTYYKTAGVYSDGQFVQVKFMTINKYGYENSTMREFKVTDLDERIARYKEKIGIEFAKRHENTRLLRNKEIYKWKRYIETTKYLAN
jgi:hypothetical protein